MKAELSLLLGRFLFGFLESLQHLWPSVQLDCHAVPPKAGIKRHADPPLNHRVLLPTQLNTRQEVIHQLTAGNHIVAQLVEGQTHFGYVQVRRLRNNYLAVEQVLGLKRTTGTSSTKAKE